MVYLREQGFRVITHDVQDMRPVKVRNGVSPAVESCHTALVDGYVVEGHVPAGDVRRLIAEKPDLALARIQLGDLYASLGFERKALVQYDAAAGLADYGPAYLRIAGSSSRPPTSATISLPAFFSCKPRCTTSGKSLAMWTALSYPRKSGACSR